MIFAAWPSSPSVQIFDTNLTCLDSDHLGYFRAILFVNIVIKEISPLTAAALPTMNWPDFALALTG